MRARERAFAQMTLGEAADGIAESFLVGRELEVHVAGLMGGEGRRF
jgi:hypothetical protein